MEFKKRFIFLLLCIFSFFVYSENYDAITYKKFFNRFDYLGFPMSYKLGLELRKNDIDMLLPFAGIEMDLNSDFEINGLAGFSFQFGKFFMEPKFKYELYSASSKPFSNESEYYGELKFGINSFYGQFAINSLYGKKRIYDLDNNKFLETTVIESLSYKRLLIDNLITKISYESNLNLKILPQKEFSSYDFNFYLPAQFNWYKGESCFLFQLFYTDYLNLFSENNKYNIYKSYPALTGRIPLHNSDAKKYQLFSVLETEQRFYLARLFNNFGNFFVSLFGNITLGLTEDSKLNLLYQYGIGAGYNMFNCVPFTFQLGLDNNSKFIMYLGIVSKLTHSM